jgi:putative hemolysin
MLQLAIIITLSMSISFVCSIMEACLLSMSLSDIARMSERHHRAARIWTKFREDVSRPVAVILITNTLAHTIGATISGALFISEIGQAWLPAFSTVYSLAMIQWTEILPKTLGVTHNRLIAVISARPLNALVILMTPVVMITSLLNRPFEGRKHAGTGRSDPMSDISVLIRYASTNRIIAPGQKNIIDRTLKVSGMRIRDIMIPRDEIKSLTSTMSLTEALIEAHLHHHTRLPLARNGDLDDIMGYVNFKDIVSALQVNPRDPSLAGICRPVLVISEDNLLPTAFDLLTKGSQHIAVVQDGAGKTVGLVTLEDIIEEIVGDINDEYDMIPAFIHHLSQAIIAAGGGARLSEVNGAAGLPLPEIDMNIDEFARTALGRGPRPGDRLETEFLKITLRKVRRSKVFECIIEKK